MNRSSFLLAAAMPFAIQAAQAAEPAKNAKSAARENQRPNILCIVCEDISPYLGCYGDPVARTPNLDAFARQGVRYTNMYTTVGVSSPSRFALITGMYPSALGANNMRTGAYKGTYDGKPVSGYQAVPPAGVKCYTEYLRAAGYYCANNSKTDYQFAAPKTAWDDNGNKAHWKNAPEGMPFMAIFNLGSTHESQLWKSIDKPLAVNPADIVVPPYLVDDHVTRKGLAVMYSNIYRMDEESAALLAELEESGKAGNTIVIWYSDNGGPIPRGKREIYQTGANVPFMIRYPDGRGAGSVERRMSMFVDIPATILSLCGIAPPEYMHGKAFAGKYDAPEREYVYGARDRFDEAQATDKQGAVCDGRYRYVRNYMPQRSDWLDNKYQLQIPFMKSMRQLHFEGKLNADQEKWFSAPRPGEEFYDLQSDPYELHNLIDKKTSKPHIERLRKEYDKWIAEYNSMWMLPEEELYAQFYPGGEPQKVADPSGKVSDGVLSLSCHTLGASMAYRLNGKGRWLLYTAPVPVGQGNTIEAVACRAGFAESATVSL